MNDVRYRGHLKVLEGQGPATNLPAWVDRATGSFETWAERLPGMAAYLRESGLTDAAVAVEAAGLVARLAAVELKRASLSVDGLAS